MTTQKGHELIRQRRSQTQHIRSEHTHLKFPTPLTPAVDEIAYLHGIKPII